MPSGKLGYREAGGGGGRETINYGLLPSQLDANFYDRFSFDEEN